MAIVISGKTYRNIQEQVAQNTEDIAELQDSGVAGYTAGEGIDITNAVISVDTDTIASVEYVDESVTGFVTEDEVQDQIEDYVAANPATTTTGTLSSIKIGDTSYTISGSGGEPNAYIKSAAVANNALTLTKKDDTTVVYQPDGVQSTISGATATLKFAVVSAVPSSPVANTVYFVQTV